MLVFVPSMRWHTVSVDHSFEKQIGSLPTQMQEGIAYVLKCLEEDVYCLPDGDYVTQRDEDGFVVCQHLWGWGHWALVWSFEFWPNSSTDVKEVVAFLSHRPQNEQPYETLPPLY